MAGTPTILALNEFLKVRGKHKKPTIVYFNEQQWANLTRGLKATDGKPPKTGVRMTLMTFPGLAGGFIEIRCPVGGPITGAEGELRCGDKPGVDFPDPPSHRIRLCGMSIRKDGTISCQGGCNGLGTCRKRSYGISSGPQGLSALLVVCQC